jgi:L-ascorbate metabolism protein UlaG (beta-lactamase superfamily)
MVGQMRLTKYTHACVRIENGDDGLVVDPGVWSEPAALEGAGAVLVTHEHADHVDAEVLKAAQTGNPQLPVFTVSAVVDQLAAAGVKAQSVAVGDMFSVAGFEVSVVGGAHAEIYDGLPGCANIGFVITGSAEASGAVYHPGDSVFVPDAAVGTLLVPVSGPWLKLAEAIDFVRAVKPERALPIHDALFSDIGLGLVDRWLAEKGGTDYSRLAPGESVDL